MEIAVEPVEADRILYGLVTYTNLELWENVIDSNTEFEIIRYWNK